MQARQHLSTTKKGSDVVEHPPGADAIKKCSEFSESVDYLLERLVKKLKSVGLLDGAQDLVTKIKELAQVVHQLDSLRGNPHDGDPACFRTPFQNLQIKLAKEAQEKITNQILDQMKMDYALSNTTEFLRGYSVGGKPLDPQLLDSCDKLFNAWLAEHGLLSKQGQIYEVMDNGEIKTDDKGEPIKADATKVRALLKDPVNSFEAYLGQRAVKLSSQEHPYPTEQQPIAKKPPQAPERAQQVSRVEKPVPESHEKQGGVEPDSVVSAPE